MRSLVREPWLLAVLAVGLFVRAVLIPITHGDDFVVWDLATKATLHGSNIFAHHPPYPNGPYAYFPLFLYLETPFQWLAQHTSASFLVLGKLPILAADVACALLIAGELRWRGRSPRAIAGWTAAFFLDPLVLYNSAYYGRFDTLGCAFLLLALRVLRRDPAGVRGAITYGLAVAAKTFPGFLVFGVLRRAGTAWRRTLLIVMAVLVVISLPYLGTPRPFVHDLFIRDANKLPGGLGWQSVLLNVTSTHGAKLVSYAFLAVFVLAALWLSRIADVELSTAATLVAFIICSKVVLEQYLIWPLPWLLLLAATAGGLIARGSLALAGVFTLTGMLDNESYHPFGRPDDTVNLLLAACCIGYLLVVARASGRNDEVRAVAAAPRA